MNVLHMFFICIVILVKFWQICIDSKRNPVLATPLKALTNADSVLELELCFPWLVCKGSL